MPGAFDFRLLLSFVSLSLGEAVALYLNISWLPLAVRHDEFRFIWHSEPCGFVVRPRKGRWAGPCALEEHVWENLGECGVRSAEARNLLDQGKVLLPRSVASVVTNLWRGPEKMARLY